MPHGKTSSVDKFAARVSASCELPASELLALCTEELHLKSAVLDGLADGILVHSLEGAILYFNPAAAAVYGFEVEEFARLGAYGWVPLDLGRPSLSARILLASGVLDFQSLGLTAGGDGRHRGPRSPRQAARPR